MSNQQPPTISRREIRSVLKRLREQARQTQQQVADTFGWSSAKVIRIEGGKTTPSVSDVTALLSHFKVPEDEMARLQAVARNANRPGIVKKYGSALSKEFAEFLESEEYAQRIWSYQTALVPGPLQ